MDIVIIIIFSKSVSAEIGRSIAEPIHAHLICLELCKEFATPIDCEIIKSNVPMAANNRNVSDKKTSPKPSSING